MVKGEKETITRRKGSAKEIRELLGMDEHFMVLILLKPLTDMFKKGIKPDICSFTILAQPM
jgi:hypothetical protein